MNQTLNELLTPQHWNALQWAIAALAAFLIGASKAGFGGLGTVFVLLMASIMEARASTGFVLPLLLVGDVLAVFVFNQHANWTYIRRLLPPTMLGVVTGYWLMSRMTTQGDDHMYKVVIGVIVLVLCVLQIVRMAREHWFERFPDSRLFSVGMGGASGVSTMLANNAGPIASWYFLASGLPKMELVGTAAWFFLIVNLWKVPWSYDLGLINTQSLRFGLYLIPAVPLGVFAGRWLLGRISQRTFELLLLAFSLLAALRLIFS